MCMSVVARVAALVVVGGCATAAPPAAPAPLLVTRLGAADSFGPGLVAISRRRVEFRMTRPGHVILIWVAPNGFVEPVFPLYTGDRDERPAGTHVINTGEVKSPLDRHRIAGAPVGGRPGRVPEGPALAGAAAPDSALGHWMLIVSDVRTSVGELRAGLDRATPGWRGKTTVPEVLRALPLTLVGGRAGVWAAYYAPAER